MKNITTSPPAPAQSVATSQGSACFFVPSSVLCGVGGVLGLPCQRVGDVSAALDADAVVVLVVPAHLLFAVEPRGLGSVAHRAVRCPAVAQAAAKEGTG